MSNSQSSGIELSTILLYALDEKGQIQYEPEPPRGIGEEHVFFSTGETLASVFYLKTILPQCQEGCTLTFF